MKLPLLLAICGRECKWTFKTFLQGLLSAKWPDLMMLTWDQIRVISKQRANQKIKTWANNVKAAAKEVDLAQPLLPLTEKELYVVRRCHRGFNTQQNPNRLLSYIGMENERWIWGMWERKVQLHIKRLTERDIKVEEKETIDLIEFRGLKQPKKGLKRRQR